MSIDPIDLKFMETTPNQRWNPSQYAKNARFVADLGAPVLELLAPQAGERILDLGCGDGVLTKKLQILGCEVLGVDASPEMVMATKNLGIPALVMSGEKLSFEEEEFDAVFSNAALHWMTQPDAVISGVYRSLKPGGRFVGEFGGYGNVAKISGAIASALLSRNIQVKSTWFFPHPDDYRPMLEAKGFSVQSIELIPRPTPLPGHISSWLATFAQSYTAVLPASDQQAFIAEVVEILRPDLCDADGQWTVDYVRLRFFATKAA
ncbi:MAG: methyltransferase domain-containing protein [Cyanobacteria bacterium P01_F01_bin.150]